MRVLLLLGSVALMCAPGAAVMAQEADARRQFEAEALRAWQEVLPSTKKMVGKWEGKDSVGGKLQSHYIVELKQNKDCCLVIMPHSRPKTSDTLLLFASNREYFFALRKKKDDHAWILTDSGTAKSRKDEFVKNFLLNGLDHLFAVEPGVRLTELVTLPYFRILGARYVVRNNQKFVELEFDSSHDMLEKHWRVRVQKGTLVLDPLNFWCLKSANLETVWQFRLEQPNTKPAKQVREYTYRSERGVPIPERILERESSELGEAESHREYAMKLMELSDDSFYLSAFGLPEMSGLVRQKPVSYHLWIIAGSIFLLALAAWLRPRLTNKFATKWSERRPSASAGETRPGFTLIELLGVIALIGVLIALVVPAVQHIGHAAMPPQP